MTYSLRGFKLRLLREKSLRLLHEINELAHIVNFRFGHVPAVADVKLGGGSSLDLCANAAKSAAENQSRSRYSLFYVLEHLDRGSGNALSALVRHDHEGNFASLLVCRKRRCRASPRNMSSRVAIPRGRTAAGKHRVLFTAIICDSPLPPGRPTRCEFFAFQKRFGIDDSFSQLVQLFIGRAFFIKRLL